MWKKFMVKKAKLALLGFMMVAMLVGAGCVTTDNGRRPAITEVSQNMRVCGDTAYITLTTMLMNMANTGPLLRDLEYIKLAGINNVKITIDSPGGSIFAMWAVCDTIKVLQDSGVIVHTHAKGIAASAAASIFLMGDVRTMGDRAILMIHAHSGKVSEYKAPSENEMLKRWSKQMIDQIVKKTKMSREEAEKYVSLGKNQRINALYMDKEEATRLGFVTE